MTFNSLNIKRFLVLCLAIVIAQSVSAPAFAQEAAELQELSAKVFSVEARAVDGARLVSGNNIIALWGVQKINNLPVMLETAARIALDEAIGRSPVTCEVESREGRFIQAQCVNGQKEDLGLLMLQQGYVSADRSRIYGSVFEEPYIGAENDARRNFAGIWGYGLGDQGGSGGGISADWLLMAGFVVFGAMIAVFAILALIIMKGFHKITDAQERNLELSGRERHLRDKERSIIAKMLDSEIKANKSKIEAYLLVYEEMLNSLKDPDRQPKYKKAGDIVQKQPVLNRSVFDRNTDKLDVLGDDLSSEVVHFYARIKTKPDYVNLEPETPLSEAISILEEAVKHAQKLNKIANGLIDSFNDGGMSSADFDY